MKTKTNMEKIGTGALIKPLVVGGSASTWGVAIGFINWITPYMQFASLTIGLTIWIITLYGLIIKIIKS